MSCAACVECLINFSNCVYKKLKKRVIGSNESHRNKVHFEDPETSVIFLNDSSFSQIAQKIYSKLIKTDDELFTQFAQRSIEFIISGGLQDSDCNAVRHPHTGLQNEHGQYSPTLVR